MGRLQKKKNPQKKKKKRAGAAGASSGVVQGKNGTPDSATRFTPGTARAKRTQGATSGPLAGKASEFFEKGWIGEAVQFLREVRIELKKVTWPSRKQTIGSTAVVLVLVIIVSLFLGVTDFILGKLVQMVLG